MKILKGVIPCDVSPVAIFYLDLGEMWQMGPRKGRDSIEEIANIQTPRYHNSGKYPQFNIQNDLLDQVVTKTSSEIISERWM